MSEDKYRGDFLTNGLFTRKDMAGSTWLHFYSNSNDQFAMVNVDNTFKGENIKNAIKGWIEDQKERMLLDEVMPETHLTGHVSIENEDTVKQMLSQAKNVDLGYKVSRDGRVWICINGIAFLRFKGVRND